MVKSLYRSGVTATPNGESAPSTPPCGRKNCAAKQGRQEGAPPRREHAGVVPKLEQVARNIRMSLKLNIEFDRFKAPAKGVLIVFCDDALKMGAATRKLLGGAADLVERAAEADGFTGKSGTTLDIIAPAGLKASRLVVIGCGKAADLKPKDFLKLGGVAAGKMPSSAKQVTVVAELPAAAMSPEAVAGIAVGATLRTY